MRPRRPHRADLQPAVGGGQEEVGRVVGVRELQHALFEPSLVSGNNQRQSNGSLPEVEVCQPRITRLGFGGRP